MLALWVDWIPTFSLVFGGCCTNVVTLEQLTSEHPDIGSLLTFLQFLVVSLYGLPKHVTWTRFQVVVGSSHWHVPIPCLKPRKIHIASYAAQVALFYAASLLNNAAFAYQIPMAVHIIFRSGGLVVSMLLGWAVAGKRYNTTQVLSILLVTAGVIITTSASKPTRSLNRAASTHSASSSYTYAMGIGTLTVALFLSGFLGLVQDWTYSRYRRPTQPPRRKTLTDDRTSTPSGRESPPWQESMFYLHALALPMFLSIRHDLISGLGAVDAGQAIHLPLYPPFSALLQDAANRPSLILPRAYVLLALNMLTQLLCAAGVHRLATRVSALTVTLVLVVRKAASFIISVLWLRNAAVDLPGMGQGTPGSSMMWWGAGLVLIGTIGYSHGNGGYERMLRTS